MSRLDEIQTRRQDVDCPAHAGCLRADFAFLLDLARKQQAQLDAVTTIVEEWEAHDNPAIGTHIVREALEAKP